MEVVKLGEREELVLKYIGTHRNAMRKDIAQAVGKKPHVAYITGQVDSLTEKGLIEVSGEYKSKHGRPAPLYSLTFKGLSYYLLKITDNMEYVINTYNDFQMMPELAMVFEVLNKIDFPDKEAFFSNVMRLVVSLFEIVDNPIDLLKMVKVFIDNRFAKLSEEDKEKIKELTPSEFAKPDLLNEMVEKLSNEKKVKD